MYIGAPHHQIHQNLHGLLLFGIGIGIVTGIGFVRNGIVGSESVKILNIVLIFCCCYCW